MFTWGERFINLVGISTCHKRTSLNPFFSYFTLAGNSEERLTDLFCKLKTTVVTCTIELDLWTSHRSNLCFDFAVLQEHLGPGGGGGGEYHTLPIPVCAAQRGRDFEAPDLERGIHFRGVF